MDQQEPHRVTPSYTQRSALSATSARPEQVGYTHNTREPTGLQRSSDQLGQSDGNLKLPHWLLLWQHCGKQ